MTYRHMLLLAAFLLLPASRGICQGPQKPSDPDILNAITSCATYLSDVLLDDQGKSRCDYQMLEGKWYDYEPPWHTGQIVYALVEAYNVTKNDKFLRAARRGGDWWTSLQIKEHPTLSGMVRAIHGDGLDYIVFATVSDGTAGLYRLFEATGEKRYAEVQRQQGSGCWQTCTSPKNGCSTIVSILPQAR